MTSRDLLFLGTVLVSGFFVNRWFTQIVTGMTRREVAQYGCTIISKDELWALKPQMMRTNYFSLNQGGVRGSINVGFTYDAVGIVNPGIYGVILIEYKDLDVDPEYDPKNKYGRCVLVNSKDKVQVDFGVLHDELAERLKRYKSAKRLS